MRRRSARWAGVSLLLLFSLLSLSISKRIDKNSIPLSSPLDSSDVSAEDLAEIRDGHVVGIASNAGLLAAVLQDSVVFYDLNASDKLSRVGKAKLPHSIDQTSQVIELRILNRNLLLVCDAVSCSLCKTPGDSKCREVSTSVPGWDPKRLRAANGVLGSGPNGPALLIRLVNDEDKAAIVRYNVDGGNDKLTALDVADDVPFSRSHNLATAFSRNGFSFFVGSVTQPDAPLIFSSLGDDNRTFVRITRLCEGDRTPNLESRMDLALSCNGLDPRQSRETKAASYDAESDMLYVVLASPRVPGASPTDDVICRFNMVGVNDRFNFDWNTCQNTTYADSQNQCKYPMSIDNLPAHCYIYTWLADAHRILPCSTFGGSDAKGINPTFDVCRLYELKSSAYRYGWLEDFLPFKGDVVARLPAQGNPDITSLVSDLDKDGGLFVANAAHQVMKIPISRGPTSGTAPILWQAGSHLISKFPVAADSKKKVLLLGQSSELEYVPDSCQGLYRTCDDLKRGGFSDPLDCQWCEGNNGDGAVVQSGECSNGLLFKGECPPRIIHAYSTAPNQWQVVGMNLDALANPQPSVCDNVCKPTKLTAESLTCNLPPGSMIDHDCQNIQLVGDIGPYKRYVAKMFPRMTDSATQTDSSSGHRGLTRGWKAVIAIVTIIAIILLLVLIIYIAKCYYRSQHRTKDTNDGTSSTIPFNPINLGSYTGSGEGKRNTYLSDLWGPSPYEQLFKEIDQRLKIAVNDLLFETEIGRGHFGVVNKATYTPPDGPSRKVACKMLQGNVSGVAEFIRLIMDRFNHPRVMQLLGIAFTEEHYPIIVTDYMVNGDLVKYLRNPQNTPTLRQLLQFAIQIAEGMNYLHSSKFIHRDLAARNCMLDGQLNIKIADFGLCRQIENYGQNYEPLHKNRDLPLRWMAVEALESEQFTYKGDVWAYGVVLWELMTRGLLPYHQLQGGYLILEYLQAGRRLLQPPYCPIQLYDGVMLLCWARDPAQRPTFERLIVMVRKVVEDMEETQQKELNAQYERVTPLRSTPANSASTPTTSPVTEELPTDFPTSRPPDPPPTDL